MTVPTYDQFIEPLLRFLAAHPDGARARDVYEEAAKTLRLTEVDKEELLPSGTQQIYKNRAGWAHDRLKRAGYSTSPRRGHWQLTAAGFAFARSQGNSIPAEVLAEIATGYDDVSLRLSELENALPRIGSVPHLAQAIASPDDRLEQAVAELRATTRSELLETLGRVSPGFFETLVLDVLHKLGYGTSRSDLLRVGRTGDGGIDGIISLDRLGLEKVYVQAKRWANPVGRPDVQAFYGALAGQRAREGVMLTTSTFTVQAQDFVKSVESVVLVDGSKLADLMIDFEVGVSMRPVRVPKIDTDYFEEGD